MTGKICFENSTPNLLRGAYLLVHRHGQDRCAKVVAVTADQFVLLKLLGEEGGLTQKELGKRSHSDANTISHMVRIMQKRDLVERRVDLVDRRAVRVYLTPKGFKVKRRLDASYAALKPALRELLDGERHPLVMQWLNEVLVAYSKENSEKSMPLEEPGC